MSTSDVSKTLVFEDSIPNGNNQNNNNQNNNQNNGNSSEESNESEVPKNRKTLDDYLVIQILGSGGQGEVRKVRRKSDGKVIALKILNVEWGSDKFNQAMNEVAMLEEISKPQCNPFLACYYAHYYDFVNNKFLIEMEFIEGTTLDKFIFNTESSNRNKYLLLILKDLITAIKLVHSKGIIHSDIKPDNILITKDLVPKLVDFGAGCKTSLCDKEVQCCRGFVGTARYLSPEVITQRTRYFSSDIWSLGVTLYYCATKKYPFNFGTIQDYQNIIRIIISDTIIPLNTNNQLLNEIVNESLIKNPFNRISPEEISDML